MGEQTTGTLYDEPMIDSPLTNIMLAVAREVLIFTTPRDSDAFRNVLGDRVDWGMQTECATQPRPHVIAEVYIDGKCTT